MYADKARICWRSFANTAQMRDQPRNRLTRLGARRSRLVASRRDGKAPAYLFMLVAFSFTPGATFSTSSGDGRAFMVTCRTSCSLRRSTFPRTRDCTAWTASVERQPDSCLLRRTAIVDAGRHFQGLRPDGSARRFAIRQGEKLNTKAWTSSKRPRAPARRPLFPRWSRGAVNERSRGATRRPALRAKHFGEFPRSLVGGG